MFRYNITSDDITATICPKIKTMAVKSTSFRSRNDYCYDVSCHEINGTSEISGTPHPLHWASCQSNDIIMSTAAQAIRLTGYLRYISECCV